MLAVRRIVPPPTPCEGVTLSHGAVLNANHKALLIVGRAVMLAEARGLSTLVARSRVLRDRLRPGDCVVATSA
jgi:hypothetical protein